MPAVQNTDSTEVERLTAGMSRGEEAAWSGFHRGFHFALLRHAASIAPRLDADDVCQLVYVRVARHIKVFVAEDDFRRWLCCIVRCVVQDLHRERTRRNILLERFAIWMEQRRNQAVPLQSTHAEERLSVALDRMPAEDAILLRGKYAEGRTTAELASQWMCSEKAIESRLARLRALLKRKLMEDTPDA